MNVREALEKKVGDSLCGRCSFNPCRACIAYEVKQHFAEGLAPIIERALRAAYAKGFSDGADDGVIDTVESLLTDSGVTAGVAAMMEEEE